MRAIMYEHLNYIRDYFLAGGMVMIPLLLVSVIMSALIINRMLFLRRLRARDLTRTLALECIKAGKAPDTKRYKSVTALLVREFLSRGSGRAELDKSIMDEVVIRMVSSIDKHTSLINALAALAPMLGLLGTVTGMIATFDTISIFGTGNAKAMAGGISEALISTQTGLVVAIPGLYMGNYLRRGSEVLKQRVVSVGMYLRQGI